MITYFITPAAAELGAPVLRFDVALMKVAVVAERRAPCLEPVLPEQPTLDRQSLSSMHVARRDRTFVHVALGIPPRPEGWRRRMRVVKRHRVCQGVAPQISQTLTEIPAGLPDIGQGRLIC